MKRQCQRSRCHNMSDEDKQRLKQYQQDYRRSRQAI